MKINIERNVIIISILILLLQIFDIMTTYITLSRETIVEETNPLYLFMFQNFGILYGLILTKLLIFPILFYLFYVYREEKYRSIVKNGLFSIWLIYIFVVSNNIYWIYFYK